MEIDREVAPERPPAFRRVRHPRGRPSERRRGGR